MLRKKLFSPRSPICPVTIRRALPFRLGCSPLLATAASTCSNRRRPIALNELDSIGDVTSADPIVSQELSQQLDRALAALPVEQRSAFVLAEIEELPYAEIARIERTSLGTVKSRIHRAKQRLQSLLEPVMRESK